MSQKVPQDHKPKAEKGFAFQVGDKTYHLPRVTDEAGMNVPGGVTRAAVMYPDDAMAQMRLAFHMLETVGASEKVMAALDSLSTPEMLEVIGGWMGESQGSSQSSETTEEPSSTTTDTASTSE